MRRYEQAKDSEEGLVIALSDAAIGARPGDSRRPFEPFVKADEARTSQLGGTGFGLRLSKR